MKVDQNKAIPSLVVKGKKQDITALVVSIKKAEGKEKERLLKAIAEKIYLHRALLSEGSKPGIVLALFNVPAKQFRHELEAIRAAVEIAVDVKELKSLEIGIGIHSGKAAVRSEGSENNPTIFYTCLGNTVNLAKKLANKAVNEVFVSETVHRITEKNIKDKKVESLSSELGQEIYSITKISEREKYSSYIKEFVNRIKREEEARKK